MKKIKPETQLEKLNRLQFAALTLTPDQIEACAWVMGGSGAGWNRENIGMAIEADKMLARKYPEISNIVG